jgi:hypothetical protein
MEQNTQLLVNANNRLFRVIHYDKKLSLRGTNYRESTKQEIVAQRDERNRAAAALQQQAIRDQ